MARGKTNHELWFDCNVLEEARTIMLADEIDTDNPDGVGDEMANYFLKGLRLLERKNSDPITVIIRSLGGETFAGMAIFDAIKLSPCHITADIYGAAMSMGAVIAQAADTRRAAPNAIIMLHDGSFSVDDHPRDVENWAKASRAMRKNMYTILAERTGKPRRYWAAKCESDYILTAKEALDEGLIDEIMQPPKTE